MFCVIELFQEIKCSTIGKGQRVQIGESSLCRLGDKSGGLETKRFRKGQRDKRRIEICRYVLQKRLHIGSSYLQHLPEARVVYDYGSGAVDYNDLAKNRKLRITQINDHVFSDAGVCCFAVELGEPEVNMTGRRSIEPWHILRNARHADNPVPLQSNRSLDTDASVNERRIFLAIYLALPDIQVSDE